MDPISLASSITALLTPFFKRAGNVALDRLAQQLPEATSKVWTAVQNRVKGATEAASDLAKSPNDAENEIFFRKQLQKALEKDKVLASELAELFDMASKEANIIAVDNAVVANNNSVSVGKITIGGAVSGKITIGNDEDTKSLSKSKISDLNNANNNK